MQPYQSIYPSYAAQASTPVQHHLPEDADISSSEMFEGEIEESDAMSMWAQSDRGQYAHDSASAFGTTMQDFQTYPGYSSQPRGTLGRESGSIPSRLGTGLQSQPWPYPRSASYTAPHHGSSYHPESPLIESGDPSHASPSLPTSPGFQPLQSTDARQYPPSTSTPLQQTRSLDEDQASVASSVRTPGQLTGNPLELNKEDRLLVSLKQDQSLSWKEIAARLSNQLGKTHQVAALQMRYKRLRERNRAWTKSETQALIAAHEYWEKCKWDIISSKVRFILVDSPLLSIRGTRPLTCNSLQ